MLDDVGRRGHRIERSLALGHFKYDASVTKYWIETGKWEIELAWQRYPAKVQWQVFYDPKGERIKG